jgi:Pyruvate/2-oxoacid:ferredoxin oxidoreductase delta subunit
MGNNMIIESSYISIAENIDKMALRAPMSKSGNGFSKAFLEYLQVMFTPQEAEIAKHLNVVADIFSITFDPAQLLTPTQLVKVSGRTRQEVQTALKQMSAKNSIIDIRKAIKASSITWPMRLVSALKTLYNGEGSKEAVRALVSYITNTIKNASEFGIQSFFEFISLQLYAFPQIPLLINIQHFDHRVTPEALKGAKLYKKFFLDEGYSRLYQTGAKGTPLTRTIPVSEALAPKEKILVTEEAHKVIDAAANVVLSPCPCRSRNEKLGIRKCKEKNPVGFCIMLGMTGMAFEGMGLGKKVTKKQAKHYLDEMIKKGLVPITTNMEETTSSLICTCCECCCSQTPGRVSQKNPTAIAPSNFYPQTNRNICSFCGICEQRCIFNAVTVNKKDKTWRLNPKLCIGCGVCAVGCKNGAVKLYRRERSKPFETPQQLYQYIEKENRI